MYYNNHNINVIPYTVVICASVWSTVAHVICIVCLFSLNISIDLVFS